MVRMPKGEESMKPEEVKREEPVPSLVKIEEFLKSISKSYAIESLGGFAYWIKREGAPPKWPFQMWKNKLDEYLGRKI